MASRLFKGWSPTTPSLCPFIRARIQQACRYVSVAHVHARVSSSIAHSTLQPRPVPSRPVRHELRRSRSNVAGVGRSFSHGNSHGIISSPRYRITFETPAGWYPAEMARLSDVHKWSRALETGAPPTDRVTVARRRLFREIYAHHCAIIRLEVHLTTSPYE